MKKEIKNQRILFLIAVMVIGFAFMVSGQTTVHRYENRSNITTVYPDKPIVFECIGKNDSLMISMFIDRVNKDTNNYKIFVHFPKDKDASKYMLTFRFEDKSFKNFEKSMVNADLNYAEYIIDQDGMDRLYWMKVIGVMFESKDDTFKADLVTKQDFFFHFLHICNK